MTRFLKKSVLGFLAAAFLAAFAFGAETGMPPKTLPTPRPAPISMEVV